METVTTSGPGRRSHARVDALVDAVADLKNGDAFAPVTVVVGSPAAAVSVRRAMAARRGVANVRTVTPAALAATIAGDALDESGRSPLTTAVRRRAIGAAVRDAAGEGASLGAAAEHAHTLAALDARFRELRRCPDDALRALRACDDAAGVLAVYDHFRSRVADRWYDEVDVVEEAIRVVTTGRTPPSLGRVVVDVLPALCDAERRLVAALDAAGLLAIGGETAAATATVRASNVIVAPEPESEVRLAIGELLRLAETGIPFAAMAVAHPGEPYGRLLPELLDEAGVPWGGRSGRSLADTVTGGALLRLLALADSDFARTDVMALLASAPIVDPATGEPVPQAQWERMSRDAHVVARPSQWAQRLDRLANEISSGDRRGSSERAAAVAALRSFVTNLADAVEPPAVRTWTAYAAWATELLRYVADVGAEGTNASDERARVESAIASLASLDAIAGAGAVSVDAFIDEVARQLSAAFGDRPLGAGVTIGRPGDLVGTAAEAVLVLGMNEGTFPRRRRDDPLLPDDVRERTSGALPTRRERRAADLDELISVVAHADELVLCAAAADQRAQQRRLPSRWLLAWSPLVDGAAPRRSSDVTRVASFSSAVLGDAPTCEQEAALHHVVSGGDVAALGLGRNVEALLARHATVLSPWEGVVGPHPGLEVEKRVFSPTAVEVWASCPFKHFLRSVLRVEATVTPEDRVGTDPLERGTLVHAVLERFVRWRLAAASASGTRPSPAVESEVLDRITAEVCDEFASAGRVGRPVPWELERRTLRADLAAILAIDAADEAATGLSPALAEASFGQSPDDDFGVAEVELADGRVIRFRGQVDRVDVSADGSRVRVVDYKTGRSKYYKRDLEGRRGQPPADPTAGGRRLQLPVYATAVAASYPGAEISAEYWFVTDAAKSYPRVGVRLDAATQARFLDVITQIADAIDDGVFPAHPGADQLDTWENCRYCEYDRVCPARRSESFERRRDDEAIVRFLGLKVSP